jgi:hypothetical protein
VASVYGGMLFSHKEDWNYVICRKIVGNIDHHIERNKPDSERQALLAFFRIKNLDLQKKNQKRHK